MITFLSKWISGLSSQRAWDKNFFWSFLGHFEVLPSVTVWYFLKASSRIFSPAAFFRLISKFIIFVFLKWVLGSLKNCSHFLWSYHVIRPSLWYQRMPEDTYSGTKLLEAKIFYFFLKKTPILISFFCPSHTKFFRVIQKNIHLPSCWRIFKKKCTRKNCIKIIW